MTDVMRGVAASAADKGANAASTVGSAGSSAGSSYRSTASAMPGRSGRTIFGFMAFAMLFSVAGAEIRNVEKAAGGNVGAGAAILYDPPTIFLGGTVATALLVLMADTGDTGRKLGLGLAGLTLATALLVNGGPVWKVLAAIVPGSKPTGATGATTPTGQAKPTTTTLPAGQTGQTAATA